MQYVKCLHLYYKPDCVDVINCCRCGWSTQRCCDDTSRRHAGRYGHFTVPVRSRERTLIYRQVVQGPAGILQVHPKRAAPHKSISSAGNQR